MLASSIIGRAISEAMPSGASSASCFGTQFADDDREIGEPDDGDRQGNAVRVGRQQRNHGQLSVSGSASTASPMAPERIPTLVMPT